MTAIKRTSINTLSAMSTLSVNTQPQMVITVNSSYLNYDRGFSSDPVATIIRFSISNLFEDTKIFSEKLVLPVVDSSVDVSSTTAAVSLVRKSIKDKIENGTLEFKLLGVSYKSDQSSIYFMLLSKNDPQNDFSLSSYYTLTNDELNSASANGITGLTSLIKNAFVESLGA